MGAAGQAGRSAACAPPDARHAAPARAGSSAGEVEFLYEVVNQDGVVAMTQRSLLLLKRRPQPLAN